MTTRIRLAIAFVACSFLGAYFSSLFAQNRAPANWKELEINFARANVELAQARLAMAKSENAAVAGTIPRETMAALAADIQVSTDRLRMLESGQDGNPYGPQILAATGIIKSLETAYNESIRANQLAPGTVKDVSLRRQFAEINVAKARLASLQVLAQQPPEVRTAWEFQLLQNDISALWARPLIED